METLITEEQIAERIDALAARLVDDLGETFTCAALMDGAFIFSADVMRALSKLGARPRFESLGLSSYGDARRSSGTVTVTAPLSAPLEGQTVVILDDVLESGRTLAKAIDVIKAQGAARVLTCVFARKPYPMRAIDADYVAWEAPDRFIVGYGLDDAGRDRGLPFIGALD